MRRIAPCATTQYWQPFAPEVVFAFHLTGEADAECGGPLCIVENGDASARVPHQIIGKIVGVSAVAAKPALDACIEIRPPKLAVEICAENAVDAPGAECEVVAVDSARKFVFLVVLLFMLTLLTQPAGVARGETDARICPCGESRIPALELDELPMPDERNVAEPGLRSRFNPTVFHSPERAVNVWKVEAHPDVRREVVACNYLRDAAV